MNTTEAVVKTQRVRRVVSAREKAAAVLAVWSGRRNPARVCRELGVSWGLVNSWEKRALIGIFRALGGLALPLSRQGELGNRLEGLLTELKPSAIPERETEPAPAVAPRTENAA